MLMIKLKHVIQMNDVPVHEHSVDTHKIGALCTRQHLDRFDNLLETDVLGQCDYCPEMLPKKIDQIQRGKSANQ